MRYALCAQIGSFLDLGLLQLAAVIDEHGLDLRKFFDGCCSRLAGADSCVLDASKREMNLGSNRRCIDVGDPPLQFVDSLMCHGNVSGIDGSGKAIFNVIGDPYRVFKIRSFDYREHGTEDLFFRNPHAMFRFKQGRLYKKSLIIISTGEFVSP